MDRPQHRKSDPDRRVMIVDRYRLVAEALAAQVAATDGFQVAAVVYPPAQVTGLLDLVAPDVLLIDTGFDPQTLVDLLADIGRERPGLTVVAMSEIADADQAIAALSHGVGAWLPKSATVAELRVAIEAALAGHTWIPQRLVGPVLRGLLSRPQVVAQKPPSFVTQLTRRQLQVMDCLATGMSRHEIAARLVVSPHTVRTHVQEILRKAGVRSTLAALALAREAGYGPDEYDEMARLKSAG